MNQALTITGNITMSVISVMITILSIRLLVDFVVSLANLRINRDNLIYSFLVNVTEPFCKPFERLLPQTGNIGMSRIFAIASLYTLLNLTRGIFVELNGII